MDATRMSVDISVWVRSVEDAVLIDNYSSIGLLLATPDDPAAQQIADIDNVVAASQTGDIWRITFERLPRVDKETL